MIKIAEKGLALENVKKPPGVWIILLILSGAPSFLVACKTSAPQAVPTLAARLVPPPRSFPKPANRQKSVGDTEVYVQYAAMPEFSNLPVSPEANTTGTLVVPANPEEAEKRMPRFPWPPPKPSERAEIPAALLSRENNSTLKKLDEILQGFLRQAGYTSTRYFSVPGEGYAIATRMERYESDGSSSSQPDRWIVSDSTTEAFTLAGFARALFTGRTGQYRLFVFVVSDMPFGTDPETALTTPIADQLMDQGWNGLPTSIASKTWKEDTKVTVLVYEFEKREGNTPEVRKPLVTGYDHLRYSRILANLAP